MKVNSHIHISSENNCKKVIASTKEIFERNIVVASPIATLNGQDTKMFGYERNNILVLSLSKKYEEIIPFVTLDPTKNDNLDELLDMVNLGAKGLKLYSGHGMFHQNHLSTFRMKGVYKWCEDNQFPICWHINMGKYYPQFVDVMDKYPNLKVNIPHFGVRYSNPGKIQSYLNKYPNLYTDISFGSFAQDGFYKIKDNIDKYKEFFNNNIERILFGTDLVVTNYKQKTEEWIKRMTMAYMNLLSEDKFSVDAQLIYDNGKTDGLKGEFLGLSLCSDSIIRILSDNPYCFLIKN